MPINSILVKWTGLKRLPEWIDSLYKTNFLKPVSLTFAFYQRRPSVEKVTIFMNLLFTRSSRKCSLLLWYIWSKQTISTACWSGNWCREGVMEMFGKSFITLAERLREEVFTGFQDELGEGWNTDENGVQEQPAAPTGPSLEPDHSLAIVQ